MLQYDSLKEQHQQTIESAMKTSEQLTMLQDNIQEKQNEIVQLNATIDEMKETTYRN